MWQHGAHDRVVISLQKTLHDVVILLCKYRAGGIQKPATRYQQGPQRAENRSLQGTETLDVACSPQQFDVGMAPDHARRRTRRIEQDRVEWLAIPPLSCVRCICKPNRCVYAQAIVVFPDAVNPAWIVIDRDQGQVFITEFEQVAAFAAGRCTRIQHPHRIFRHDPASRDLGGRILHRYITSGKTGQLIDGHGLVKPHGIGHTLQARGCDARACEAIAVLRRRLARRIAAQPQRRPLIVRCKYRVGIVGPVTPNFFDQPTRMVPLHLVIIVWFGGQPVALEPSQTGIEQICELWFAQLARSLDSLGHGRMVRNARVDKLKQANREQRIDHAVPPLQRSADELADPGLQAPVIAQSAKAKHAQQRPVIRGNS